MISQLAAAIFYSRDGIRKYRGTSICQGDGKFTDILDREINEDIQSNRSQEEIHEVAGSSGFTIRPDIRHTHAPYPCFYFASFVSSPVMMFCGNSTTLSDYELAGESRADKWGDA